MHIPRVWVKASASGKRPDGRTVPVSTWGWGDDQAAAARGAADRLQRVLERLRKGEDFPGRYGYGIRPLREEILRTIEGDQAGEPAGVVTRNSYGAEVLNTAAMLFLDIDLPEPGLADRLGKLFGRAFPDQESLAQLRRTLAELSVATFRIYRTASGFRVMAVDRNFNPAGLDVQELMRKTGTDAAFSQLCLAQRSFRARLTPKPWRAGLRPPPGEFPREDDDARRRFAEWLSKYDSAAGRYATCRYLETVGTGQAAGAAKTLQQLHDHATRCEMPLPLA